MKKLKALIRSTRPKQWVKNLVLYAGELFSLGERTFDPAAELLIFGRATLGFVAFCLLSGATYIINDILDLDADRQHPVKRDRPIASGAVSLPLAASVAALLFAAGIILSFQLAPAFGTVALVYFVLILLYSLILKRVLILDTMVIAFGFVVRAIAGAIAVEVGISVWLVICTIFLALFLGFAKRRSEIIVLGEGAPAHRGILALYNVRLLDMLLGICGTLAVISYSLYSISSHAMRHFGPDVLLTLPFVFFGVFRYLYLVVGKDGGGDPAAALFSDLPLLLAVSLWIAVSAILLVTQPGLLNGVLVQ